MSGDGSSTAADAAAAAAAAAPSARALANAERKRAQAARCAQRKSGRDMAALDEDADRAQRRELKRNHSMRRAERERAETGSLPPAVQGAMSEEDRARLAELQGAYEREDRAAQELVAQWSRQSQAAYAARLELREFKRSLEARLGGGGSGAAAAAAAPEPRGSPFAFDGLPAGPAQPDDGSLVTRAVVVLVRTTGPVNLGQIARLCANLAVEDVRLVSPQCEPNCTDSRKFAVHGERLLARMPRFDSLREAVADCGLVLATSGRQSGSNGWKEVHTPEEVPAVLRARPAADRYAVVFGNEADGLNGDELALCHAYVCIPTRGPQGSLNLGHAVAVTMYTLSRAGLPPPADAEGDAIRAGMAASVAELTRLGNYWRGTMRRFGWTKGDLGPGAAFGYPVERQLAAKLLGRLRHINQKAFGSTADEMMRSGEAP